MSKVVDWTLGPELLRPISRSGKVFGVPIRDAIDQSEWERRNLSWIALVFAGIWLA